MVLLGSDHILGVANMVDHYLDLPCFPPHGLNVAELQRVVVFDSYMFVVLFDATI